MHILIASPYLPWPLSEGGRVAQYRTFEALRNSCDITLIIPIYKQSEIEDVKHFESLFPNIHVNAVKCFNQPPPLTYKKKIKLTVKRIINKILLTPPQVQHKNKDNSLPHYPFNCLNPEFVRTVINKYETGCDIFQSEFAEMLSLGPIMYGKLPTIFVHHQLHFVYARRFMEASATTNVYAKYLTEKMICEEHAHLNTFNTTLVFSETDKKALTTFCPDINIHVSPFPCPEEPLNSAPTISKPIKHFVFVASENHRPNVEGFIWFMQHVWKLIKNQIPDAKIEVIGKWSHEGQTQMPNHQDIIFTGFVKNLTPALTNKIMIVPVWIGSGIRTKILAAWGAACPVVTTTVGVEGLPGESNNHFITADTEILFANACIKLSQDLKAQNRITKNGLDLVQTHYSLNGVKNTRLNIYNELIQSTKTNKLRKTPNMVSQFI